jgi:hypothetical protein
MAVYRSQYSDILVEDRLEVISIAWRAYRRLRQGLKFHVTSGELGGSFGKLPFAWLKDK